MTGTLRSTLTVAAAGWLLAGLTTGARAEHKLDPTGSWKLVVKTPGRPTQESILKIEKAGDEFVGVMMSTQGRSTPLKDIKLKDDELSFRFTFERDNRKFSFLYKGKLSAETYNGKGSLNLFGQNRTFNFEGKRMKPEEMVAGLWKITLTLEAGQNLQPTLRLKQEGNAWSGGYLSTSGKELPLQDVKLKNGELSFRVVDKIDDENIPLHYVGKITANGITGTAKMGAAVRSSTLKFQAKKIETTTANIAGTWKLRVPYKDGITFEPTLNISQTGSAFSGTYHGEHGDTKLAEALIFGDEFTFEVTREREKSNYKLKYQGKVSGDTMKGGVEYDFDGIAGFLTFEGKRVGGPDANSVKK